MRRNWILVSLMSLGLTALCASVLRAAEDEDKDEVKIKLTECPQAVQKALQKAAGDAKIEEVDKETKDGKTIYETDVTIDGKNYEIKVAEDGTLISKKLDAEEDEDKDGDKNEKDGK